MVCWLRVSSLHMQTYPDCIRRVERILLPLDIVYRKALRKKIRNDFWKNKILDGLVKNTNINPSRSSDPPSASHRDRHCSQNQFLLALYCIGAFFSQQRWRLLLCWSSKWPLGWPCKWTQWESRPMANGIRSVRQEDYRVRSCLKQPLFKKISDLETHCVQSCWTGSNWNKDLSTEAVGKQWGAPDHQHQQE